MKNIAMNNTTIVGNSTHLIPTKGISLNIDPRGNSTHDPNHEKHFFEKYNHV
jgi:hypothetical protein